MSGKASHEDNLPATEVQGISAADAWVHLFFGEATDTGCRIYAERERQSEANAALCGFIRGPFCAYAQTLPINHPFRAASGKVSQRSESSQQDAGANLIEVWVPDPCFWTPAMPYLYQYTLEREVAGQRQRISGQIGIRRLGCAGDNLRFDGKRWVLRGASLDKLRPDDVGAWHGAAMAAILPRNATLPRASERGVLIVSDLSGASDVEAELRRLRSEPCVGMVILERENAPLSPRSWARNLLFAQRFRAGETVRVDDWADVAICELAGQTPAPPAVEGRSVPLVAWRAGGHGLLPEAGRALCDRLQRDLAASGINWAGYIV